jgi:predicted Zn-dependent peptidase
MNFLGNMFNAQTPLLWTAWLIHDRVNSADEVLAALDGVIDRLCDDGVDEATLRRAQVKARSAYYGTLSGAAVPLFGRCDLLAAFTLLDGDPERINHVDRRFLDVTADQVRDTARRYLRRERRTVLELTPGAAPERAP